MRTTIRDRWPEVRALFEAALAVSTPLRAAWLEEHAPDAALRDAVLALLAQESGSTLVDDAEHAARLQAPLAAGDLLGPYTVVGAIGRGGMGVVYRAEQAHPKREVAIKLILGEHDARALARFKREADALARLAHPGIASVIEVDSDAAGRPFLVMELVTGRPLSEHAAGLDRDARLELLARIAEAMAHAHERGVVHRDLKPSNILVTAEGQPKILDFGIASLAGLGAESLTETGMLLGTPAYMAPEQATGRATDARADLYALGVIGYELLANRLPLPVAGLAPLAALRVVTQDTPPPLSRIDKRLAGDLDVIFGKALAKEPELRYPSAGAFADDLRRFLAAEPIRARRPSTWRRLALYGKRQPLQLGLALATVASLVGGIVVSLWFAAGQANERVRAEAATARAERELARTESTLDAINRMFSAGNPAVAGHKDATFREVLASAAKQIEGAPAGTRAPVLYALGDAQRNLGDVAAASASFAEAERLAKQIRDDRLRLRAAYRRAALTLEHGSVAQFTPIARALTADPALANDALIRAAVLGLRAQADYREWRDRSAARLFAESRAAWPAVSEARDAHLRAEVEASLLISLVEVTSATAGQEAEMHRLVVRLRETHARLVGILGAEHPQTVRLRWGAALLDAALSQRSTGLADLLADLRVRLPELGPVHPAIVARIDIGTAFVGSVPDGGSMIGFLDLAGDTVKALPVESRLRARLATRLADIAWGRSRRRFDAEDFLAMAAAQCVPSGVPDGECTALHLGAATWLAENDRLDEGMDAVRALLQRLGRDAPPAYREAAYNELARMLRTTGRFDEAAAVSDQALAALAEETDISPDARDQRIWSVAWNYRPAHCARTLELVEPIAERLRTQPWMQPDIYARLLSTCEVRAGRDAGRALARLDAVWEQLGKARPKNDLIRSELVNAYLEIHDVLGNTDEFARWAAELQSMVAAGLPTSAFLSGRFPWIERALALKPVERERGDGS